MWDKLTVSPACHVSLAQLTLPQSLLDQVSPESMTSGEQAQSPTRANGEGSHGAIDTL